MNRIDLGFLFGSKKTSPETTEPVKTCIPPWTEFRRHYADDDTYSLEILQRINDAIAFCDKAKRKDPDTECTEIQITDVKNASGELSSFCVDGVRPADTMVHVLQAQHDALQKLNDDKDPHQCRPSWDNQKSMLAGSGAMTKYIDMVTECNKNLKEEDCTDQCTWFAKDSKRVALDDAYLNSLLGN